MSDKSTPMPKSLKVTREWASDWSDRYEQNFSDERLSELVGKTIKAEAPPDDDTDERKGFTAYIVGYSVDTLVYQIDDESEETGTVYRYSVIADEGKQFAILASMEISEVTE